MQATLISIRRLRVFLSLYTMLDDINSIKLDFDGNNSISADIFFIAIFKRKYGRCCSSFLNGIEGRCKVAVPGNLQEGRHDKTWFVTPI